MSLLSAILAAFMIFHILEAREPDIDINRLKPLIHESSSRHLYNHKTRSISREVHQRSVNDGYPELRALKTFGENKDITIKVHPNREDPRLFYQSDTYLNEIRNKNASEVSLIYPGNDVVYANENKSANKPMELRLRSKFKKQGLRKNGSNLCVKCPHDRTLIAKAGLNKVLLQRPRISSCRGLSAPRDVRFTHMYGPKFGSILDQGSHTIVGRIMYKGKNIQHCKMEVHVIVQDCPVPKGLIVKCENHGKHCNFSCHDPQFELHGVSSLTCEENMKWSGTLPVCKTRTWCERPVPSEHGLISCRGVTAKEGAGLTEGSKCRIRCARGWHWSTRGVTTCHRGSWTHKLICQPNTKD